MTTTLYYCPGCGEFVDGSEPCECVFVARGTVDEHGVLHTAIRVPVDVDDDTSTVGADDCDLYREFEASIRQAYEDLGWRD